MAKKFFSGKRNRLIAIIFVVLILLIGGYFLFRNSSIFADTDGIPAPTENSPALDLAGAFQDLYNGEIEMRAAGGIEEPIDRYEFIEGILKEGNYSASYPPEAIAQHIANTMMLGLLGEERVSNLTFQYNSPIKGIYRNIEKALTIEIAEHRDNHAAIIADLSIGRDGEETESPLTPEAERAAQNRDIKAMERIAMVNADVVIAAVGDELKDSPYTFDADAGYPVSDQPSGGTPTSDGPDDGSDGQPTEEGDWDVWKQDNRDFLAHVAEFPTVRAGSFTRGSNFEMNPITGQVEYTTTIDYLDPGSDLSVAQGQIRLNPFTQSYSGHIDAKYAGRDISLHSDPVSGSTYLSLSGKDGAAFRDLGFVEIDKVIVGQNGQIGGSFKFQNRAFNYNPVTKKIEIPIAIGGRRLITPFAEGDNSNYGTVYLDSSGKISRGLIDVSKIKISGREIKGLGSIFVDRNGTFGYAQPIRTGGSNVGMISINSNGEVDGSVNVTGLAAKALGNDALGGIGVYYGLDGFQGASAQVGDMLRLFGRDGKQSPLTDIGIGVGRDGALSLSFSPIGGILGSFISVGLSQNEHGNFYLRWPGGKLRLFGSEKRPLTAPELTESEDGGPDMGCIYFRHSFKKAFQTIRVYQVPCTQIEKEEQLSRGKMIFDIYNELLQRNPSMAELSNWYFYAGHQLYKFPQHENDKAYRMERTESWLRSFITGKGDYARAREGMENPRDNLEEYRWISSGKSPESAPTRPAEIFQENIFENLEQQGGAEAESTEVEQNNPFEDFINEIEQQRLNDPGVELGDSYDGLEGIDPDTARANVDLGDTQLETIILTRSGDYPVIERLVDNTGLVITLRKGYNEVFTPEEVGYINLIGVEADGIKVFEYDPTYSDEPGKSFIVGPETMKPGTGYYIHNAGKEGRRIVLRKKPSLGAGEKETVLKKGWNLIANSSPDTKAFGDIEILTTLPDWSGGCDIVGLCVEKSTLGELLTNDKKTTRLHSDIYFLVPSPDPLEVKKFINVDISKGDFVDKVEVAPGQMFWTYLFN